MRWMLLFANFFFSWAVAPRTAPAEPKDAAPAANAIPKENLAPGEGPPDRAQFEACAKVIVDAIQAGDPQPAIPCFFPADAFDLVKNIPVPGRYHKRLVGWYEEDVVSEKAKLPKASALAFGRFEPGKCRWKDKGTEGNKTAYWSCVGSHITVKDGEKTRRIRVQTIINWGDKWFVTHLGPIRP